MKSIIINLQKTIFLLWKILLYFLLMSIFIGVFSFPNPQLLRLSRTLGVTLLTFAAVGYGMINAYGKFDIGQRKSKPIIYSLGLAVIITDIVTYIQLAVMNTNPANNDRLKFENLSCLILVMGLQVLLIVVMTYLGNYVYFRINHPEISCIVTSSRESMQQIYVAVNRYKKQYNIKYILD